MTPHWPTAAAFWAPHNRGPAPTWRWQGRFLRRAGLAAAKAATLAVALAVALGACAAPSGTTLTPVVQHNIKDIGSDTIVNLALAWAQAYGAGRPEVNVSVTGGVARVPELGGVGPSSFAFVFLRDLRGLNLGLAWNPDLNRRLTNHV